MGITETDVQTRLRALVDPNTGKDFVSGKAIRKIHVDGANVDVDVQLGYPAKTQHEVLRKLIADAVAAMPGAGRVGVSMSQKITSHSVQRGVKLVPGVKNIIAVASGKGGVGKSTTAVNLALALAAEGAQVGVLDADIYGPSQPMMLGIAGRPESKDGKTLEPLEAFGLQAMSIGFLIDMDTPMVWRGPMVTQALEQLLKDTNWRDLDYLIVDMPPGTGDIQLTLSQKVPVTGVGDRHHAAGHRAARRPQGPQDVREGQRADHRHRREHEHARLLELRPRRGDLRRGRRGADVHGIQRAVPGWPAARHPNPRTDGRRAADRGRRSRRARSRTSTGRSRAGRRCSSRRRRRTSPPNFRRSSSRTRSRVTATVPPRWTGAAGAGHRAETVAL